MNYQIDFFEKEAKRIINLLKSDFILEDGSLCLEKVGKEKRPYHIFPDMGDFLPFFLYFGEKEFIDKQINIFKNLLSSGFWVSEHPTRGIKGLIKSYEYTDLLYGLANYYESKKDKESYNLLRENVEKAISAFNLSKNPSSFYLERYKVNLPIMDSRDGMFIELMVDLCGLTGDEKYLSVADNLFFKLTSGGFYKKYSLFPNFSGRGLLGFMISSVKKDFFEKAEVMKYTTNCLHAFLALYRKTHNEKVLGQIINIINGLKKYAIAGGGGVVQFFDPHKPSEESYLGSSFSVIDFLCDFYDCHKRKEDLEFAEEIADFWIQKQGETGLFPLYSGRRESFVDFQTDMSIALSKLYELTGKEKYQNAVERCMEGFFKWHGGRDYILGVDIDTGEILNVGQRTKFISLFLKFIILKLEKLKGKNIYSDDKLLNLIEDR